MQTDENTIERLKSILLEMLDVVDKICRENGISYFLDSGTALGAIRHGGFIPWDDDVDIGMLREDYDRFLSIAPKYLPPDLILQNEQNEPTYYLFFSKLRKRNTRYPEYRKEKYFSERGFQIDIFPFDYIGDDLEAAKKRFRRVELLRILAEQRMIAVPPEAKRKIPAYYLLKLLPREACRKTTEKAMREKNDTKKRYVASYAYVAAKKKICIFPTEAMTPVRDVEFEGRRYMIMHDPDCYLKLMYGDYMKLPPVEQRKYAHLGQEMVF